VRTRNLNRSAGPEFRVHGEISLHRVARTCKPGSSLLLQLLPLRDSENWTRNIVNFIPSFDVTKRLIEISTAKGQVVATARYENLIMMIKLLLSGIDVNEEWYLRQYPDVGKAIRDGGTKSAKQHYIDNGYFENRLPFPVMVDDGWYKREYPDVAESIKEGTDSSQEHFVRQGYKEGRMPFSM
jgi:hypothetical protein